MNRFIPVLVMFALGACGDEDRPTTNDSAICESFAPCGGDPVGQWTVTGQCNEVPTGLVEDCPEATAESSGITFSGTYDIRSDMTFTADIRVTGVIQIFVPASCLPPGFACADDEILTCVDADGGGCDCTFAPESEVETGSWEVSESRFATSLDFEGPASYCVEGDVFQLEAQGTTLVLRR